MKVSVVMPVYNEQATLRAVIARVLAVTPAVELLCVDDGSSDGSREILAEVDQQHAQLKVFLQPRNMGKGAALRAGRRRRSSRAPPRRGRCTPCR